MFLILIGLSFQGCNFFQAKEKGEIVLAKVYEKELLLEDIRHIIPPKASSSDSIDVINRYVKSWITKQLVLRKAESELEYNEVEVERKVQDYKYALLVYEYQKKYIKENLDTFVTDNEIENYYKENIDNFELKQNIVKGIFIKIPGKAPRIERIRTLIKEKEKNYKAIHSYCYRFASDYVLADTVWNNFDEMVINTPFSNIPDKVQFLKRNKFAELSDSINTYLINIEDYKIVDQNSPLEFVKPQIINNILNKRKITQIQKLEREIYNKALKDNNIEIFTQNN